MKQGERELLEELQKVKNRIVIVEGKKDKEALYSLGLKKVYALNGNDYYNFSEKFKDKKVLILTDFGPEGTKIAKKLKFFLQTDNKRRKLKKIFIKNKICTIQALKKFKGDIYVEACTNNFKIYNLRKNNSRRNNRKARCYRSCIWTNRRVIRT